MNNMWKVGDKCTIAYPDPNFAEHFPKALSIEWEISEFAGDMGAVRLDSLCGNHTAGVNVENLERISKRGDSSEFESSEYTADALMESLKRSQLWVIV